MTSMVTQNIVDLEHVNNDNNDIMETEQNNNDILPNKKTIMQTDKINDPKKKIDQQTSPTAYDQNRLGHRKSTDSS